MNLFLLLIFVIKIVTASISIDLDVDNHNNVTISYSGIAVNVITDKDIELFKINNTVLKDAIETYYGRRPKNVYLRSPTPWGDLYHKYAWEQVSRVLSIKSARVKGIAKNPVVVVSQDFENLSQRVIKVNTGLTHTVENTLTTSWSKSNEITVSQEINYNVNVIFAKAEGTTSFSYSSNWGVSEERSKTVTLGTNMGMETELQPGQAVTTVLSAEAGYLEVEVTYKAYLKGDVAVNYKTSYNGHHFWAPPIKELMKSSGLENEVTTVENIKFGFHIDGSLRVYDKATGAPL